MGNTWKYSSVGQSERYKLIGDGNADVYHTEKELNNSLRSLRKSLGLSTAEVDKWDADIDKAFKASANTASRANLPKFASSRIASLNKELGKSIKDLQQQRDESIESVNAQAENSLAVLEEWLAANGYFKDGSLATRSKKEIEDALTSAIADIKKDYETKLGNTRSKFLSMAR